MEYRPLGECVRSVIDHRGLTPKKLGGDWAQTGYRAISAKNIKSGKLVQTESINMVAEPMYQKWMPEEIEQGDVLITSEAPFGEVLFWNSDERIVLSQRVFGLKPELRICNSRYLYYWMKGPIFQHELRNRATGTTVIGLRQPELLKCSVALPPLEVQYKIAHLLGTIDDKINTNSQLNDYLAEINHALYLDFISRVQESDRVGSLSELAEFKYGKDHKKLRDGTVPVYGSGGIMRHADSSLFEGESVLVPRKGTLNNVLYVNEKFWTVDTMFYTVPKMRGAAKYVYEFLSRLDLASMNSGSAVPSMTTKILEALQLPIPRFEELKEFDDCLERQFALQRTIVRESQMLADLRDALLPRLMSGEIDITNVMPLI